MKTSPLALAISTALLFSCTGGNVSLSETETPIEDTSSVQEDCLDIFITGLLPEEVYAFGLTFAFAGGSVDTSQLDSLIGYMVREEPEEPYGDGLLCIVAHFGTLCPAQDELPIYSFVDIPYTEKFAVCASGMYFQYIEEGLLNAEA